MSPAGPRHCPGRHKPFLSVTCCPSKWCVPPDRPSGPYGPTRVRASHTVGPDRPDGAGGQGGTVVTGVGDGDVDQGSAEHGRACLNGVQVEAVPDPRPAAAVEAPDRDRVALLRKGTTPQGQERPASRSAMWCVTYGRMESIRRLAQAHRRAVLGAALGLVHLSVVPEAVVRFAAEQMGVGPGESCQPTQDRICSRCPSCGQDPTGRPRSRRSPGCALTPAELSEPAGASRTTAVPVRSSGRRSSPDDRTTAQNVAVRRSSGQRTSVTRCSLRAPQLELYTCTCTLLIPPPQSTQWPLPYT